MRLLVVANPASRSGRGRALAAEALRRMRATGATSFDVLETEGPGHAARALRAVPGDVDRVIACGGDGLVSEVASALASTNVSMAIIPTGRGNDLARALGVPLPIDQAVDVALGGEVRRIDLGEANGRPFCTVAACGLDAEVSRRARKARWPLPGPGIYVVELLRALAGPLGMDARLEHDNGVLEERVLLLAMANTGFYGGGFRVAPGADPADGVLDACVVGATSRAAALALFPRVMSGRHVDHPAVTLIRSTSFRLTTTPPQAVEGDGEHLGETPCEYRCRPGALAVVTPRRT